ncbi:MAG: aminotransferase class I/II-fold pyridoxal phosphate-dependent enzyme [Candidatus Harrisonbacteria bacterium]|nr:aminotransferase class I/II-fold pyridoxal phosphate-dependent enzyme [Candidatus Harrisonbacteria bacterium]
MSIQPSSDLGWLSGSATEAAAKKMRQLKTEGKDVIDLTQGRPEPPDFPVPEGLKLGEKEAIRKNKSMYTPVAGIDELREVLAEQFSDELGVPYTKKEILVSSGGRVLLKLALQVLIDKHDGQDEVLYATPAWPAYTQLIKSLGGRPIPIKLKHPFKLKYEDIAHRLQDVRIACILLNTPNNPTGAIIDPEELEKIAKAIEERDRLGGMRKPVALILDWLYRDIVFNRSAKTIVSVNKSFQDRTIVIDGASKTYNATGLRICYAAGPRQLIEAMTKIQSLESGNANSRAQYGLLAALTKYKKETERELGIFWRRYKKRRDCAFKELSKSSRLEPLRPEGTFYIWVKIPVGFGMRYQADRQWVQALLEQKHVGVIAGDDFGCPGYIRLSLATSMKNVREGVRRIREFAEENQSPT